MQIRFHGRDIDQLIESDQPIKLREALLKCNILPSTVIISFQDKILPMSTILSNDVELLVTIVSSGG